MFKHTYLGLSLGAFLTLSAPVLAAPTYPDVPATHWAYQALEDLAQKYHLKLSYPDGHFKGEQPLNRYQMAVIVHKMLFQLSDQSLDEAGQHTLTALKKDFAKELLDIQERLQYVEDQTDVQAVLNEGFQDKISQLASQHNIRPFGSLALRYCGMTTNVLAEPNQIFGNNLLGNIFQVRMGAGITGRAFDDFDYQLRVLTTDNNSYNLSWFPFGGNTIPRSPISLDRFFIRYRPGERNDKMQWRFTFGKSRNFFPESELVFDEDISFSGLDQHWSLNNITPWLSKLEAGVAQKALLIEDTKITSSMLGAKTAASFQLGNDLSLRTGGSYLHYLGTDNLAKFNFTQGYEGGWGQRNRGASSQDFESDFRLLNGFFKARYAGLPLPLNAFVDYAHNLGAADKNKGLFAGVTLGEFEKTGDWALSYIYKYQEQDYNISLFVDDTTGGTDTQTHSFEVGKQIAEKTRLSATLHIRDSLSQQDLAPLLIFYTTLRQDF